MLQKMWLRKPVTLTLHLKRIRFNIAELCVCIVVSDSSVDSFHYISSLLFIYNTKGSEDKTDT